MTDDRELIDLADWAVSAALRLGAEEVAASASRSDQIQLAWRAGKIEQASEAVSRGLSVAVLVGDRYTSNATSDLRKSALSSFLADCVAAARELEPDVARRLPAPEECGRGASEAELDLDDPVWLTRTPDQRAADVAGLEAAIAERPAGDVVSTAANLAEGRGVSVRVTSGGFSELTRGAWFSLGGETTLRDGERRPEAAVGYAARYYRDLPSLPFIADDLRVRAEERLGSGPVSSGVYPAIIENRVAGRILGLLLGPIAGITLHEGRSCFRRSLGEPVGSSLLTILDDPLIPRGLASHAWDGDGRRPVRREIVAKGVLRSFYLNTYYARKLGMTPTSGGRSNWVVEAGPRPWQAVAADWPQAILVTGFLGGNANPTTGDFSFGIRGRLVENGVPTKALSEMNMAGNLGQILHDLVALGDDVWTYGSTQSPALIFGGVRFSGK